MTKNSAKFRTLQGHTITHVMLIFNHVREYVAFAKPLKPTAPAKACQRVCLSLRTDDRKESTIAQHCISVMRADVQTWSFVLLFKCSAG